ncbi:hypothetical protein P8833_21190, partial [Bacillus inaquosorum]|nr:hypothetical protein [Bacillus inaquosorum]
MKVIIIEGTPANKCTNDCYHYSIKLYRKEARVIAIYVRVSTEEQAIKGSSIDSQIEACINRCVEACYEGVSSASFYNVR